MNELLAQLFGSQPSYAGQLLGEDEARRLQQQAQQSGLLNVGLALLAGAGPSPQRRGVGELLAQGVMAGQQAYQGAFTRALQEQAIQDQIAERRLMQSERMRALQEQQMAQQALPQVLRRPATEVYGEDIMGQKVGEGVKYGAPQLDLGALLSLPLGVQQRLMPVVSGAAEAIPKFRKAGLTGEGGTQENPFVVFTQDPTVPQNVRTIAEQYARSFSSGQLDPEKADERVRQLGEMVQRSQQFQQTQSGLEAARAQSAAATAASQGIQQQMLELRREAEAAKPEQFSYQQKKDFDVVAEAKDAARQAGSNASIAQRASTLLKDAYSGAVEAGVKGALGAVGVSTKAKEANDSLMRLSNQLAVNAPKFTGPTSDRDAARYDAAVGDLANPSKSIESKRAALKDIKELSEKAKAYADQAEQYYYSNKKSLRGFQFKEPNPYDGM